MGLSVATHAANTSEMGRFADDIAALLSKLDKRLCMDMGVASKANLGNKQIDDGNMRKIHAVKEMPHWQKAGNQLISSNL